MTLTRKLLVLVLFAVSFAFVESSVVIYLRTIYQPLRHCVYGEEIGDELFPMLWLDDLRAAGPEHMRNLYTELVRELATMVMLVAVALAVATNYREGVAAFMVSMAVWDIFYYVFVKVVIDWPSSLLAWDLLFLLPLPWVGPVISPILVAVVMIAVGVAILWRESRGRPVPLAWPHWATIIVGALIIITAFCWDWRNVTARQMPSPFNWPLFAVGEIIASAGFAHALLPRRTASG
jgi:hypothetical protein